MDITQILVVEDSKTFNKIITTLLSEYHYSISQVYALSEAKEILQANEYDFILLDLNLPDSQGEELLETIKSLSNAKIIVMTGDESSHHRDEYFQKGIIDYFIKTTPIQIIATNIHSLIETINSARNSNILTIDDSSFVRSLLKNVLTEKGYNVYAASSAIEGLGLLRQHEFNLILLDLIMPGLDGISFLEKLKEDPVYCKIPIVVISGDTSRNNYSRVLKNGASDFIRKPFVIEEILLKCDVHIKTFLQAKKIIESEKEMIKQKSISKLLENIAHHWRQPLTAISTHASSVLVNQDIKIEDEEKVNKRLEEIIDLTQVLSNTIDDFQLLFAQVDTMNEINSHDYINDVLSLFEEYIEKNDITLNRKITVKSFKGYKKKLKQILTILLKNIEAHAQANKHIFISIEQDNANLEITIKDSGGGVEKELLNKLFEPYYTTKHQAYSKGIGLYIAYQLINEDFNGFINAKNVVFTDNGQPYKGLEFKITIPIINEN